MEFPDCRLQATFADGEASCELGNKDPLQIIRGRQCYIGANFKSSGFDPITEIVRNLFCFHFWGMNSIGNAKDFRQILQALNYRDDNPSSRKRGPSKRGGEYSHVSDLGMLE